MSTQRRSRLGTVLILASAAALSTTFFLANPISTVIDVVFAATVGILAGLAVYGARRWFAARMKARRKP